MERTPQYSGAFATTLKSFCRRFCMAIKRSRYYEVMPLEGVRAFWPWPRPITGRDLDGDWRVYRACRAGTAFSLVGLLSGKLTNDEGLDVLSYGLDLFDDVLEETDGDGPWTVGLAPPPAVEDALAGYIWAGLASPEAATRWKASHVVVSLCALDRTRVLEGLFHHASANTISPFSDARFPFYGLHAQQWLLMLHEPHWSSGLRLSRIPIIFCRPYAQNNRMYSYGCSRRGPP